MRFGFEVAKGYEDVRLPQRATKFSAGYDFYAVEVVKLPPNEVTMVHTGVKAFLPSSYFLELCLRSSLSLKGLMLANGIGVVDCDYYGNEKNDGEIAFLIRNCNDVPFKFSKGDKIGQGIFTEYFLTDNDYAEGKRTGGFGSTGE
jgi:dUTP pyrophosphatase